VLLYCSRLRGPLTRRLLRLRVVLTRRWNWYISCFRCFAHCADRPRKCLEVYARRARTIRSLQGLRVALARPWIARDLGEMAETRLPAPVPARNARSSCPASRNVFWICLDPFAGGRSSWTVRSRPRCSQMRSIRDFRISLRETRR
jgi:hypothetical protein